MAKEGLWVLSLVIVAVFATSEVREPPHERMLELGANFEEIVNQPNRDVFVDFYVDWCKHCHLLIPELNKVAEHFKRNDDVVVAKINAERNIDVATKFNIQGFPSLMLFSKSNKKGEMYFGPRDFDSFVIWLQNRGVGLSGTPTLSSAVPAAAPTVPPTQPITTPPSTQQKPASTFKVDYYLRQLIVADEDEPVIDDSDLQSTEDGFVLTKDDEKLFWQYWEPESAKNLKGFVLIVPGLGDHSNLYLPFRDHLNRNGFGVYAFDLRGNGRSTGERAFVNDWEDLLDDLHRMISLVYLKEKLHKTPNPKPLFLIGHNLGSTVAVHYAINAQQNSGVQGIVSIGGFFNSSGHAGISNLVEDTIASIWPTFTVDSGVQFQGLSSDPEFLETAQKDKYIHFDSSARLSSELRAAQNLIFKSAGDFSGSIYFLHGENDSISPAATSQALFEQIGSSDKKIDIIKNGLHRVHDDQSKVVVWDMVRNWLNDHL